MLRLQCRPSYTLSSAVECAPELQVNASAPAAHTTTERAAHNSVVASITLPRNAKQTPPRAVVSLDLYTSIQNSCRQLCRVHSAYANLDLYKLLRCRRGQHFNVTLVNKCYAKAASKASVCVTVMTNDRFAKSPPWPLASRDHCEIERRMNQRIAASIGHVERMKPTTPILRNVLAPVYQGRVMELPGVAYFMQPVHMTEACAQNMLNVVLRRHNMGEAEFCSADVATCAHILAEVVQAFPASMPYVWDVFPDRGKLHAYESFDDLLRRRSGDCEDFTKCICSLFEAIRFRGGTWTNDALRRLHDVSTSYLAVGVLGTIDYNRQEVAHMHAELHPLAAFTKRAGLTPERPFGAWEYTLPVLPAEATSHCFRSALASAAGPLTKTFAGTTLPFGYELPHLDYNAAGTFYKQNAHIYTNYFMERDKDSLRDTPAFFSFMASAGTYGVPFSAAAVATNNICVHPPYTAADRADMKAVLALHVPSPTLQAPRAFIGAKAAAPFDGDDVCNKSNIDFFCATPSDMQRRAFLDALNRSSRAPQRVEYHREAFCAGFAPQVRIRAYFGRD